MVHDSPQLRALKARVRKQARTLAESESLAMQHMQYAAELELELNHCRSRVDSHDRLRSRIRTLEAQSRDRSARDDDRARLQQELEIALQTCQQLRQQVQLLERTQVHSATDRPATREGEMQGMHDDNQQLNLETSHDASEQPSQPLTALQAQISDLQAERDLLQEALELRPEPDEYNQLKQLLSEQPTLQQLQEARRRQEVAEAHHLVLKKQYESQQKRLLELEDECRQAHSYGQSQEKEVSELEQAVRDLEAEVDLLKQQNQQLRESLDRQRQPLPRPTRPTSTPGTPTSTSPAQPLVSRAIDGSSVGSMPKGGLRPSIPPLTLPYFQPAAKAHSAQQASRFDNRVQNLASSTAELVSSTYRSGYVTGMDQPMLTQSAASMQDLVPERVVKSRPLQQQEITLPGFLHHR